MILSITGIVLGVVAIGVFIWLKKEQKIDNDLHEVELNHTHEGLKALMKDINNYQVRTDRELKELSNKVEINRIKKEKDIEKLRKDLPSIIRRVIGHIEFAQPLDKK